MFWVGAPGPATTVYVPELVLIHCVVGPVVPLVLAWYHHTSSRPSRLKSAMTGE